MSVILRNGDCMSELRELGDKSVQLVLTDPPYNLGLFMTGRQAGIHRMRENFFVSAGWDNLEALKWEEAMDNFFQEVSRIVAPGGAIVCFMAVIKVETIIRIAQKHGFYYKTTGVWHKTNPMPRNMNIQFINSNESWIYFTFKTRSGIFNNGGRAYHDHVETSVTPQSEKTFGKHPTQKPVSLMKHFVSLLSNPGDVVLDPFMGSGSTGVAATMLGRSYIGIELDQKYFNTAQMRIQEQLW